MGTKHDAINPRFAAKIVFQPATWFKPYERNARTHSPEQLDQIAASIAEFGFVNPILSKADGTIIAGHGRHEAATSRLSMAELPVIILDHLSDKQARLLVLADNKIAMNAGWDEELLAEELQLLETEGAALDLTGFGSEELDEYLGNVEIEEELPGISDAEKPAFQQITFTLHNSQAEKVKAAIRAATGQGKFTGANQNDNGNALARIAAAYLEWVKQNGKPPAKPPTAKQSAKKKGGAKKK